MCHRCANWEVTGHSKNTFPVQRIITLLWFMLEEISRKCSRSVLRGLAGSTRSMDFDVVRSALHLTKAHLELDDQGPAHPRAMLITATIFPLRAGSFRIGLGGHFI